jgi:hypothetical protein
LDGSTPLQRSPNATFQIVADEAILIHLQTGVYYSLNEVGTAFWELLDGTRTLDDCASHIAAEYNAPPEVVKADLVELAGELAAEGLITQ